MPRFLIPVDGSENAQRAVRHVVALAAQLSEPPHVVLLNVQPPIPAKDLLLEGRPSEIHRLEAPEREHGAIALAPAESALRAAGLSSQSLIEIGEPAPVIASTVRTYHCDEIVMGARGLTPIDSVILGSVSARVIHLATVPVVLVK